MTSQLAQSPRGGDVIDTSGLGDRATMAVSNATSGTAITLATATALATEGTTIAVADDEAAYFAKVASTSTIDTVAEVVTALADGWRAWMLLTSRLHADGLLILSEDNGSTLFVYGVDNDGTAAIVAGELALLATVTSSAECPRQLHNSEHRLNLMKSPPWKLGVLT